MSWSALSATHTALPHLRNLLARAILLATLLELRGFATASPYPQSPSSFTLGSLVSLRLYATALRPDLRLLVLAPLC